MDKLHQFGSFLQRSDIEPLFKSLSATQTNWPELQSEILQVVKSTNAKSVREHLISSAMSIFSKPEADNSPPPSRKAIHQNSNIGRALVTIHTLNLNIASPNWPTELQIEATKCISMLADDDLMKSWLLLDKIKDSVSQETSQIENISQMDTLCSYCVQNGGLLLHLVLLLIFCQVDFSGVQLSRVSDILTSRKFDALSYSELQSFSDKLKSLETTKLCEGTPRINIFCGAPSKFGRYDIHGPVGASVLGLNQQTNLFPSFVYFEMSMKVKDGNFSGVRIGWGSQGTYFSHISKSGRDDTHWLLELSTGRIIHDDKVSEGEAMSEYEIANLFGIEDDDEAAVGTVLAAAEESSSANAISIQEAFLNTSLKIDSIKWDSGKISCVYSFSGASALYFINGKYIGKFTTNHNWTELDKRDLAPIFVGTSLSHFELNLGQQPFQYLSQVSSFLVSDNDFQMDDSSLMTAITKNCAENFRALKYLSFNSHTESETGRGYFAIKDVTQDAVKSFTIELSVRVRSDCEENERIILQSSTSHDGDLGDGSIAVGIGAENCFFFSLYGCSTIYTPKDSLQRNVWCHLSVTVAYTKSSGKLQINFFINGLSYSQAEIRLEKNTKTFKVPIKLLQIGSPLATEERKPFIGDICNIRLWGLTHSGEKITSLMNKSKIIGNENELLTFIPCDEGFGIEVHDCSNSKNPARRQERLYLQGDSFWGTASPPDLNAVLDSVRTGWEFPLISVPVSNITCLSLALQRMEILYSKLSDYLENGSGFVNIKHDTLDLATFLSDYDSLSFEVIKALLMYSLRKIASGVEQDAQSVLEWMIIFLLMLIERGLKYTNELSHLISLVCCPLNLRYALFMIVIFIGNGCSFLPDSSSLVLVNKAQNLLATCLNQFIPDPQQRLRLLIALLDSRSKSIDETRPLPIRRSSSMDGAHNVHAFVRQEFSQALHNLKPDMKAFLHNLFLQDFTNVSTLSAVVSPNLRPKSLSVGGSSPTMKDIAKLLVPIKKVLPEHGDFVQKGSDWKYADDVGNGIGIVLTVTNWKDQPNTALFVLWENNHIGKYRYAYSVTADNSTVKVFDVEVLGERNDFAESIFSLDAKVDSSSNLSLPGRIVSLSPSKVVSNLLAAPDTIEPSFSKRSIVSYMQENSDSSWLEINHLDGSVNDLINKLSNFDVCLLFGKFLKYQNRSKMEDLSATSIDKEDDFFTLYNSIIRSIEYDTSNQNDATLTITVYNILTGILFGAIPSEWLAKSDLISVDYYPDTFGNSPTGNTVWDWQHGEWSVNGNLENGTKETTSENPNHIIYNFPLKKVPANIQARHRGRGLELTVQGDRDWATVVFDSPILPNTGVYRWYVKIKFSERRGQVLLGLCTDVFSPSREPQLGLSEESWGLSPSLDLYHGGKKRRLTTESHKLSSGSILEFIVDTDLGTLKITELGAGVVNRYGDSEFNISEKFRSRIIFPAISLNNPGDSALFIGDPGDIKVVQGRMNSGESRSSREEKGIANYVWLGCPKVLQLECLSTNLSLLSCIFDKSIQNVELLANVQLNLAISLIVSLGSLRKWGNFSPSTRSGLFKSLVEFTKNLLGVQNVLNSYLSLHALEETNANVNNILQWRKVCWQLFALSIELLGKLFVEMVRSPVLGSSFNEYIDVDNSMKIESSSAMKISYSKALGSDVFIQGFNENPLIPYPVDCVLKWIAKHLPQIEMDACATDVCLFLQSLLFHIGMDKVLVTSESLNEDRGNNAVMEAIGEQIKSFVKQFTVQPQSLHSNIHARMLMVTKCVRSPSQSSISIHQDESDESMITMLKSFSDEILTWVFCDLLNCTIMEKLLAAREVQAISKADAFDMMRNFMFVLEGEESLPFKTLLLDQIAVGCNAPFEVFSGIMRDTTNTTPWHYFDGLNAASHSSGKRLRSSFSSFMSYLISDLSSLAGSGADRTLLSLMGVLAMKVIIFDHESLARSNLFSTLEDIMGDEGPLENDENKSLHNAVTVVATKLFIMMALQVASGGKKTAKDRSQPSPSMQRAFTLERMRSGPATLNRAVFDLVRRLLRKAIDRVSIAKSESLFECVTILLNVATDEDTKKVISTPDWIALLIELIFTADYKYRQRSMAILAELLPDIECGDREWSILIPVLDKCGFQCPTVFLGKSIFLCFILHIIGTFVTIPLSLNTSYPFSENGGKLIDQYQQVMSLVTEGVTLYRSFLVSDSSWRTPALACLENLFSSFSLAEHCCDVSSCILGALAVYDGYLVCSHLYSMVACPLSGETFIGVITGYVDASKERVEASGILVNPESIYAKFNRKQDLKKMVAASSVLLPIQKVLASTLPVSRPLLFGALKVFAMIYQAQKKMLSTLPTESKEEEKALESKDDEIKPSIAFNANNFAYFQTAFGKFFSCILTHPEVSGGLLQNLSSMEEFSIVWEVFVNQATDICRASDMGMFSNLEEHFHDLAVSIGNKQLLLNQKSTSSSSPSSEEVKSKEETVPESPPAASETRTPVQSENADFGVSPLLVESLTSMGFPRPLCVTALQRCGGGFEEALNYLLNNGGEGEEHNSLLGEEYDLANMNDEAGMIFEENKETSGEEGEEEEENDEVHEEGDDEKPYYHFYSSIGQPLPFHVNPSFETDRMGCLFPGDQIHILEEKEIEGVKWLRFRMADFDDSIYSATYGEDFFEFMVWIPTTVNGEQVMFEGESHNYDDSTAESFVSFSIDRCYRVIGSNGILVREGTDLSTEEITTLETGTIVHACQESFNSEGTVRMFIDRPVRGWVSKLLDLVERVPSSFLSRCLPATTTSTVALESHRSEFDIQIEDNMDSSSGNDIFTKEDRFFSNMQGRRFEFLERSEGSRLLGSSRRKKFPSVSSSASVSETHAVLMKTLADIGNLMARKSLVLLMCHLTSSTSGQSNWESLRLGNYVNPVELVKCLRLLLFRGELSYMDGYQRFLFHGGEFLTVLKQPVSLEDALVILADRIISKKIFKLTPQLEARFQELFLSVIQQNIIQACESSYSDHSWDDIASETVFDSDVMSTPSINYALWLTMVLAKSQHKDVLLRLVVCWIQIVKASSMSLKCIAYRISVYLLELARSLPLSLKATIHMHTKKMVSLRRLSLFAVKRLWHEMEDAPQYSRFMQSLTALLFQISDVFAFKESPVPALSLPSNAVFEENSMTVAAPVVPKGQMITFSRPSSHIQFTSQKDLSSPWSLRARLRRRRFVTDQVEPFLRVERDKKPFGSSTVPSSRKFSHALRLLTGEGMEDCMQEDLSRSSSHSASESDHRSFKEGEYHLNPSFLLSSSRAFIKLQKGGRTFLNQSLDDPLANSDPIADEAVCFSFGQASSDERVFDVVLPYDEWLDIMMVSDPTTNLTTLYVNGEYQDSASMTMNLPMSTLGSTKSGMSFAGDISLFQVWNYAKSMMEVKNDCCVTDVYIVEGQSTKKSPQVGNKPLVNLVYSAESVDGLFDEMGLITGVKPSKCSFSYSEDNEVGSSLSMLAASSVMGDESDAFLVTANNIEKTEYVELTGYVRISKSGKKPPLSSGIEEIVVLQYRLESIDSNASDSSVKTEEIPMQGIFTWCDKQVKIVMEGFMQTSMKTFTLKGLGSNVISGPPEKISWLRCITLKGIIKEGIFEGECFLDLKLNAPPSQPPGSVRLEVASLPSAIAASSSSETNIKDIVKVKQNSEDGQYIAYCLVQPFVLGEYLSYGIIQGQGSLWVDWIIKASSGNIAFGWTTHSALAHPDASVDANRGTWTYSSSGQASHGDDLYLCDSADEGDIISLQINTDIGKIRIFKNYELILVFDKVCDDPALILCEDQLGEVGRKGIRPFVSLVSPGDCVQLLGVKEGAVDITFPENDAFSRCKFTGNVVHGLVDGMGLVSKDANSRWEFGPWKDDTAMGTHIEIKDIRAESIEVVAVRSYAGHANEIEFKRAVGESQEDKFDSEVNLLLQQFHAFRQEHTLRGCSLFAASSSYTATNNSISQEMASAGIVGENDVDVVEEDMRTITVRVGAHGYDVVPFTIPVTKPIEAMLDGFAARNDAYRHAFTFKLGNVELTAEDTPESAGLTEGCVINAVTKNYTYDEAIEDPINHYFPNSTAPYVVMIIYEGGATVRNRIEIDDNSLILRVVHKGEIVEAFRKSITSDGIGRFKIADGWISERLRGGTEEPVVRVLKQRYELTSTQKREDLPHYRILREEGVKLRAGASFKSEDLGFCPQNTICYMDEKRMVRNEAEGNAWTNRLHIIQPEAHQGWISDKDRLIEKVSDGAFAGVDPAVQMELARRNKLRAMKRTKVALGRPSNLQVQLLQLKAEICLSTEIPFLLKKSRHCEGLQLSKDFMTVTCPEAGSGRQVVLGSKGFSHGIHYWEVHVKAANWGTVFIGVAPEDASGWNGMGFINYRAIQAFGSETLYGNYYGVNDKIGVLLDMDRGTLAFFKDGEDFNVGRVTVVNMGVAYRNVRKSAGRHSSSGMLYPCFGVKTSGDSLSIKDTHWMSYSGLDSTLSMHRAMQALSFVHSWKEAYASSALSISQATLRVMYEDYEQKCSPNFFTTDARPGLPIQLLVTNSVLEKAVGEDIVREYGLHVGCNLKTVYGPASLLGVSCLSFDAGYRVWYSCEKNGKRAWYWTVSELRSALQANSIEVLSELLIPISHRQESFNVVEREIRLSQHGLERLITSNVLPPTSYSSSLPTTPTVSLATKMASGTSSLATIDVAPWTYAEDCELVRAVNNVAIHHDHDACTLSAHMVQHHLEQKHLFGHRTPTEIHVRYTALCLLNRCVAIALPLLDLSVADIHKSLLLPTQDSSLVADTNTNIANYGRNLQAIPSPLRDLMLSIKHIIFTQTKQQFWVFALKETTVSTSLPADEYERPDEIREITVNSLKGKHFRNGLLPATQQWEQQEKMFERIAHLASHPLSSSSVVPNNNNNTNSSGSTAATSSSSVNTPMPPVSTSSTAASSTLSSTSASGLLSEWLKDMDERLKMSVFGQLMDAFANWDDRVFRKAYVHMQDAGQARAFFVKLAGEGVDDQGGPYRAVFQTAIGEEISHLFPLLVPTDNQVQGLGQQRDRFTFNLALISHHPKGVSLLVHLGKLVGVAVRHRIQVPLPLTQWLYQALCFEPVSVIEAMEKTNFSLVNSLRSLLQVVEDVQGNVFGREEREEAAEFLAEALWKSVKKLQATSRAVWTSLMTSAINGSGSGGSGSGGASFASLNMTLGDISEDCLHHMVFVGLGLATNGESSASATTSTATVTTTSGSTCFAGRQYFTSAAEIVHTILYFHLLSQNEALQLFFRGLCQVLPIELLSMFTAEELESVISGTEVVDLDVLQQATIYDGVAPTDRHVEMFWEALYSLDPTEQTLFVNFCSGRSRLPAAASDFPMPFTLTTPPPASTDRPDCFLPVARTCFFSLSLPKYTSAAVCREKLQYAIRHTEVMDADFIDRRGTSAWDQLPTATANLSHSATSNDINTTETAEAVASPSESTVVDTTAANMPLSRGDTTLASSLPDPPPVSPPVAPPSATSSSETTDFTES